MSALDPRDECPYPTCQENLLNFCLDHELGAGDTVKCPGCSSRFFIHEHLNGREAWMTFRLAPEEAE